MTVSEDLFCRFQVRHMGGEKADKAWNTWNMTTKEYRYFVRGYATGAAELEIEKIIKSIKYFHRIRWRGQQLMSDKGIAERLDVPLDLYLKVKEELNLEPCDDDDDDNGSDDND